MKNQLKNGCKRLFKIIRKGKEGILVFALSLQHAYAQDANAGIDEATNQVRGYFDSGANLMYAICAIGGLIGAVKVYQKWNKIGRAHV